MGLVDKVSIWTLEQNFEAPSGKRSALSKKQNGLGCIETPNWMKWGWFFATLFHVLQMCNYVVENIWSQWIIYDKKACILPKDSAFSVHLFQLSLEPGQLRELSSSQQIWVWSEYIISDHDIKSILRRKTLGEREVRKHENLLREIKLNYFFLLFIKILISRN